jgi:hypothetical protein
MTRPASDDSSHAPAERPPFGDYIVFADESGDHGLDPVDPNYPVFVLVFSVFRKEDYIDQTVPSLQELKFRYFGHDNVILHERDIRRDTAAFSFLKSKSTKAAFVEDLTDIIDRAPFTVIAVVVRKDELVGGYAHPDSPYDLAVAFGLERVFYYIRDRGQREKTTHVVFERRGKREDEELELEFRRVCAGANYPRAVMPFEIVLVDKLTNSAGLQVSDLIARPIGMSVLRPAQRNRAFEVIRGKLYADAKGDWAGRGLKVFP